MACVKLYDDIEVYERIDYANLCFYIPFVMTITLRRSRHASVVTSKTPQEKPKNCKWTLIFFKKLKFFFWCLFISLCWSHESIMGSCFLLPRRPALDIWRSKSCWIVSEQEECPGKGKDEIVHHKQWHDVGSDLVPTSILNKHSTESKTIIHNCVKHQIQWLENMTWMCYKYDEVFFASPSAFKLLSRNQDLWSSTENS